MPRASTLTLTTAVLAATALGGSASGSPGPPRAAAARTIPVNDTASLHSVHTNGSTFTEEGQAKGSLPGTVRVALTLTGTSVKAVFTFYLAGGTMSGQGGGRLHIGHGGYASFGGALLVNHGTGRYRHASGSGALYGAINRNNSSAVLQATGSLHY